MAKQKKDTRGIPGLDIFGFKAPGGNEVKPAPHAEKTIAPDKPVLANPKPMSSPAIKKEAGPEPRVGEKPTPRIITKQNCLACKKLEVTSSGDKCTVYNLILVSKRPHEATCDIFEIKEGFLLQENKPAITITKKPALDKPGIIKKVKTITKEVKPAKEPTKLKKKHKPANATLFEDPAKKKTKKTVPAKTKEAEIKPFSDKRCDIDVSDYTEASSEPSIVKNNFVYYCRKCHKHFQHPIFEYVAFTNRLEKIEFCVFCKSAEVHATRNKDTRKEGTCEECGEVLDNLGRCHNCDRNIDIEEQKRENAKHEHIPFADYWIGGKLVENYSNPDDPQHWIPGLEPKAK